MAAHVGFIQRLAIRGTGALAWGYVLLLVALTVRLTVLPTQIGVVLFVLVIPLIVYASIRVMIARHAVRRLGWARPAVASLHWRYNRLALAFIGLLIIAPLHLPLRYGFAISRASLDASAAAVRSGQQLPGATDTVIGSYRVTEIRVLGPAVCFRTASTTFSGEWIWFVHDVGQLSPDYFSVDMELGHNWVVGSASWLEPSTRPIDGAGREAPPHDAAHQ